MNDIKLFIIASKEESANLVAKLSEYSNILLVGTANYKDEAILTLSKKCVLPNIILCDLDVIKNSVTTFVRTMKNRFKCLELLIFSSSQDDGAIYNALNAGASGYILKDNPKHKIYDAIHSVFEGGSVLEPKLARNFFKKLGLGRMLPSNCKSDVNALTKREKECLQIVAKGLSNSETASVLNLSTATVRTHLEHIFQKLEVSNRVEAVTEGVRQGIIEL